MITYKNSSTPITVSKGPGASTQGPRSVSGFITTFGNPDHVDDIVHENAIDRHLQEVGTRLPALSGHRMEEMIGWHELKKIPGKGIWATTTFLEGIRQADEDLIRCKSGAMAYSIGFLTRKEEFRGGNRWLLDIELLEASIVFLGCNPQATIDQRADPKAAAMAQQLRAFRRNIREIRQRGMTPAQRALDNLETSLQQLLKKSA